MGFDYLLTDMANALLGKTAAAAHHANMDPLAYAGFNNFPAIADVAAAQHANHMDFLFGGASGSGLAAGDLVKPSAFYGVSDHHTAHHVPAVDADPWAFMAKVKSASVNSSFALGPDGTFARFGQRYPDNLYHYPNHTDTTKISASMVQMMPPRNDEEEEKEWQGKPLSRIISKALVVMGVCDLALGGVVMATWNQVCDAPLRWWYLGSLALGFPVSQIVYSGTNSSFRKSFIFEMAALIIAFAWLVMGTMWVNDPGFCVDTAPVLWWSVFTLTVSTWSILGTGVICVIITTVLSVIFGQK